MIFQIYHCIQSRRQDYGNKIIRKSTQIDILQEKFFNFQIDISRYPFFSRDKGNVLFAQNLVL